MSHKNTINWNGTATADAEVVGGVESSPTKYIAFSIDKVKDDGPKVAKKVADAWNKIHGGEATHSGNQVKFPGNVDRTCLISFSNGKVKFQEVPIEPDSITVAGLTVSHPKNHHPSPQKTL